MNECFLLVSLLTMEGKGLRGGHTRLGANDNLTSEVWEQGYNQE